MSEDIIIQEKALALKSILKELKKDLKKHEKVEKVPEGKTSSMQEFLSWADGKDKNTVTKKAISNLQSILNDIRKAVEPTIDTRGKQDIESGEDEYRKNKEYFEEGKIDGEDVSDFGKGEDEE